VTSYRIIPFLLGLSCWSSIAVPQTQRSNREQIQDFNEVLLPITKIEPRLGVGLGRISGSGVSRAGLGLGPGLGLTPRIGLGAEFGTGFCLDAACRFVVTNYHVAIAAKVRKIQGRKIIRRYLATGPQDKGATLKEVADVGLAPYAPNHDLAIFELLDPIKNHHGLEFDLDEPEHGQTVDIYGYPLEGFHAHRKLAHFSATYAGPTTSGLLAFDLLPHGEQVRLGGASGGIVVDKEGRIVGVLSGGTGYMALAVPAQNLADFVWKVQPFLAAMVFPKEGMPPMAADIYPKLEPAPDLNPKFDPRNPDMLHNRPEDPHDVILLRDKAQQLVGYMQNYIAVQSFVWGSKNKEPAAFATYEVQVFEGIQEFYQYPGGKKAKPLQNVPWPNLSGITVRPGDEWSQLPNMVGTARQLKIRQAPDATVNGRKLKVFQYHASVEDNLEPCKFDDVDDFVLFLHSRVINAECYGEVWTDDNMNILRISEHLELPGRWKEYFGVVTYSWVKIEDEPSRLLPLTIFVQAGPQKHLAWCRGNFTNYRVFTAHAKLGQAKSLTDSSGP
jgi:hypothetical protein